MSLNVETGSGAANSESFASVADALAYHAARGNATWATIATTQQEQALRRATDYLEQTYSSIWLGSRVSKEQALSFPRYGILINGFAILSSEIPKILINACCEMAIKAAQGELSADLERSVLKEKVASLEVTYDQYSLQSKRYVAIDNMLKPLYGGRSSLVHRIVRA
jgi:hypothetical protein